MDPQDPVHLPAVQEQEQEQEQGTASLGRAGNTLRASFRAEPHKAGTGETLRSSWLGFVCLCLNTILFSILFPSFALLKVIAFSKKGKIPSFDTLSPPLVGTKLPDQ